MPRKRLFLDIDVVEAAKQRIRHVLDTFDTTAVQYSGGKDSTALLHLVREVHEERGLGPVKVIFRDEEMLSPAVEEHINKVAAYDWVDFERYCLAMGQEIWVLGRREFVLLWSQKRADNGRLFRPVPDDAITNKSFGLDPYKMAPQPIDYYTMQGKKGMTAFFMGVRAQESMVRYRSVVQKLHENYINKPYGLSKAIPLRFAKPLYDWGVDDVFKYIYDVGAEYCEYYDYAAISGANQRVGIPLHSVAARRLMDVVRTEPEFYDRLVTVFPQIDAQRRLWADFDTERFLADFTEDGWEGIKDLIGYCMLTPGFNREALMYADAWRKKYANDPYSYPLDALARMLFLNEFRGMAPTPVGPGTRADAVRKAQILADADSLDLQDDRR